METACGQCKYMGYDPCGDEECRLAKITEFNPVTGRNEVVDYEYCMNINFGNCPNFKETSKFIYNKENNCPLILGMLSMILLTIAVLASYL